MSQPAEIALLLSFNDPKLFGVGNETFISELRQLFSEELLVVQQKINQAIAQNDKLTIKKLNHRLLGTAAYCGTARLQSVLEKIREHIHQNSNVPQTLVDEFNTTVEATIVAIKESYKDK